MTRHTDLADENPRLIAIETSPHAARGWATCLEDGAICWRGPIDAIAAAAPFDMVCCHDDDAEAVAKVVAKVVTTSLAVPRPPGSA
jgi:hypothetical protein